MMRHSIVVAALIGMITLNPPTLFSEDPQAGTIMDSGPQGMRMVYVPDGVFIMGVTEGNSHEMPAHRVILSAFLISETEVTQGQYLDVIGSNPSHHTDDYELPAEDMTWRDAAFFCNQLSILHNLEPVYNELTWAANMNHSGYRLPTEAEWEYACRAGTDTEWFFGNDPELIGDYAWWRGNSDGEIHPVRRKRPNQWGLYDMYGNVEEWCHDVFAEYPDGEVTNPRGPDIEGRHAIRGGHYRDRAKDMRSRHRPRHLFFNDSSPRRGFRVVRSAQD